MHLKNVVCKTVSILSRPQCASTNQADCNMIHQAQYVLHVMQTAANRKLDIGQQDYYQN